MLFLTHRGLIALIAAGSLIQAYGAGAAIGVARANGSFQVDGAQVSGNATLFAGSMVQTTEATSRLQIDKGTRVELGPESRVKVFGDRMSLERGATEVSSGKTFQVEARSLRIEPADGKAVAQVRMDGEKSVMVAALNGPVRIYSELGYLVANVNAGVAMSLTPEPGQADSSVLTGCLRKAGERYLLTDTTANITVELRGANLEENVGKTIEIAGTQFRTAQPAAGATQVIRVSTIKAVEGKCTAPAPAARPESTATKAGKTAGKVGETAGKTKSNGALIGIVIAGAGGGAAAAIAVSRGKSR